MARPKTITEDRLIALIRSRGPVSATELASSLSMNRTSVTRALGRLGDELVTLGAARSTRYVLRRSLRNGLNRWPLYRIDENGKASEWAELEAFHDRGWRVTWAGHPPQWAGLFASANRLWDGFPFFLGDVRPQGFLGRVIARRISGALQLPENPQEWSDEDNLTYLHAEGVDLPGDLVVGDACLRRALARAAGPPEKEVVRKNERGAWYADVAADISRNLPGSSAGGEQPKFLVRLNQDGGDSKAMLVKFSPPLGQEVGRRVGDLLLCEYHAHQVLSGVGLADPGAGITDAGGRRFLEIPRFDRTGTGGRRGVVTLAALVDALGSARGDWTVAAAGLQREGLLGEGSIGKIRRLQAFGELIGNTDMHSGNLAFFLTDDCPLDVTPSYDMLPMLWAPVNQGEIVERVFAPEPPLPSQAEPWRAAVVWAEDFWERVAGDAGLSEDFRGIAEAASARVSHLRRHVG